MPFFSIIIKTSKKSEQLKNAVYSVLLQTYQKFEIIIVNDSPEDKTYSDFESGLKDSRIIYIKNDKSYGSNFSINRALSSKSIKSDWAIILEDSETLARNSLERFADFISHNKDIRWFFSNKTKRDYTPLIKSEKKDIPLDYTINFLISKKETLDVTHCIHKDISRNVYFPKTIRQGYEWLFFYEISTRSKIFYYDFDSILVDEKIKKDTRNRSTDEELDNLELIWKESIQRKINKKATFIIYMLMRLLRAFMKN